MLCIVFVGVVGLVLVGGGGGGIVPAVCGDHCNCSPFFASPPFVDHDLRVASHAFFRMLSGSIVDIMRWAEASSSH